MIALECHNLSKHFDGITAVDKVSLSFEAGQVTALIGPNGAGKTTAFNLLNGFLQPDEGEVRLRGRSITGLKLWRIARLGMGRLFQDVRVFPRMTALENVLAAFDDYEAEAPWRAVFLPHLTRRRDRQRTARATELLASVGLHGREESLAQNLSFGQQKLVAIARLLAAESEILLLDEPAAGVHPAMIDHILGVIRNLAGEGRTILIIEHDLDVVARLADTVHLMERGTVAASGAPAEVFAATAPLPKAGGTPPREVFA